LTISQPRPPAPTTRISKSPIISKKSLDDTLFSVKAEGLSRKGLMLEKT
jgi:hypothetical protein